MAFTLQDRWRTVLIRSIRPRTHQNQTLIDYDRQSSESDVVQEHVHEHKDEEIRRL